MRRIAALDGLRGVAILCVVIYHATQERVLVGGFFGVDLFFVLSGYLITRVLLGERRQIGTISLRSFYRRRARRLLPGLGLYLGILGLAGLIGAILGNVTWGWLGRAAIASIYTTNFFAALNHLGSSAYWIGGLWSLAAEEQFYLVWPIMLVVLLKRRTLAELRAVLVGLLVLSLVGFYLIGATSNLEQLQYDPAARSIAIIAGCLLAAAPFSFRYGLALGWLLYGFTCVFCMNSIGTNLVFTPIGVFGAVLLVTHAERSRVLTFWPLIWFGWISYSLYLWHPATLRFMPDHRTLAVLLAVIVAAVSTYAIEDPIRQQGITWLRQRWRPAEPAAAAASA